MRLIDSHAHMENSSFSRNRDVLIEAFPHQGIEYIINPGIDLKSSIRAANLAANNERIFAAIGNHPHEAKHYNKEVEKAYRDMPLSYDKIIAIGEIGLDYYYEHSPKFKQKEVFKKQLILAQELDLPVIIHSRDADEDVYEILSENLPDRGGVMHCYTGTWEEAKKYLDLDMYISLAGIVTFKNAKETRRVAKNVPLSRLLIETDAPYLTPAPFRGQRNEPALVSYVAETVAEERGISFEELAKATIENTSRLFNTPLKI